MLSDKNAETQREHQWDDRMLKTPKVHVPEAKANNDESTNKNISSQRPTKEEIRHAYTMSGGVNATPGFASVAAAFDFEHHIGSDPALELKVLKSILVREGNISQIEVLVQQILRPENFPGDVPDYHGLCSQIIELLAQTRTQSVTIIEQVESWRIDQSPPPPFVWQKSNYLLKMCRDLDYLSQVNPLVELLGVSSDAMRHNPLMLENSLDNIPASPEEEEEEEGPKIMEKVRLRQAEAVLAREVEMQRVQEDQIIEGEESQEKDQSETNSSKENETISGMGQREESSEQEFEHQALNILNWYDEAQAQLKRLREPISGSIISKATGRMEIPKPERLEPINTSMTQQRRDILGESRRLTEFLSTSPIVEKRKQPTRNQKLKALSNPYKSSKEDRSYVTNVTEPIKDSESRPVTAAVESEGEDREVVEPMEYIVRPMTPSVRVPLTNVELEELVAIEQPSESIAVVAASVLILLQPGNAVPTDVRWSAFIALEPNSFLSDLTDFDVIAVPKFKLRALRRFLSVDAFNPLSLAHNGSLAAAKLAVWVLRVIAAHPEGAPYITEVRSSLDLWEAAEREAAEKRASYAKPPPKKVKKKRQTKKVLEPLDRLLDDIRHSNESVNKSVMAELKNSVRASPPASCIRVMEAVSVLLEPRRKVSMETVKSLMTKASSRGEATFESRLKDYDKAEASHVLSGPTRGAKRVQLLQSYVEDPSLEDSLLSKASRSVAVLMSWVRSAVALVVFLFDEICAKDEEDAVKHRAATKLQTVERKNQAKKRVETRREEVVAATKIQSRARVGLAKRSVERAQESEARIKEEKEAEEAATRIQCIARNKQARQTVAKVRADKACEAQRKVIIEYDDAEADRSEPKQIFALSNEVEKEEDEEEEDDYGDDDEDYFSDDGDEAEENKEVSVTNDDVVTETQTNDNVVTSDDVVTETQTTDNVVTSDDVVTETQTTDNVVTSDDVVSETQTNDNVTENTPNDDPILNNILLEPEVDAMSLDLDLNEEGENEVLSPLRTPPKTAGGRRELDSAGSFGDTYGDSDFEEFDDE